MGKVKWDEKRCQMLLRMSITRIKQQRTKGQERNKIARKGVADLLEQNEERRARIKVHAVIQEDFMLEAFNIVELCCQTVATRIELLTVTNACPPDIKEHVCSLLFAAPKMSVPELTQVHELIIAKYGKRLPCECVDQGCVNEKLVLRLKNQRPSEALVNYYLSSIAKKHNVDWSVDTDAPSDPISPPEADASFTTESADIIDMGPAPSEALDDLEARFRALHSDAPSDLPPVDAPKERSPDPTPALRQQQPPREPSRMEPHPVYGTQINLYSHAAHVLCKGQLYPPETVPIVIDNGSHKLRAGFAGEYTPRTSFHNIVGRPTQSEVLSSHDDVYVGPHAHQRRAILDVTSPLKHGIVVDWDDMSRVLHHTFANELRVRDVREHVVVLTEPQYNSARCRAAAARVLFDRFYVPAVWFGNKLSLALFGSGRTTGLLLDCSVSMCQVVPVLNGRTLVYATSVEKTGGDVLSEYLGRMLRESGHSFVSGSERALLDKMREDLCYLPVNFDSELEVAALSNRLDTLFPMPDGQSVPLSSERIRAVEPLYSPAMVGVEGRGLAHLVLGSIMKCEAGAREAMLQNIVLSGALTQTTGFAERLCTEIRALLPPGANFSIAAAPDRDYLTWQGASMVASGPEFRNLVITREAWLQKGDSLFT